MQVTLQPITKDNWKPAARLKVGDDQQNFVAPNWYSIIQTLYEPETLSSWGIYDGENIVGFTMLGYEPEKTRHWIIRLMIALDEQGKGYGRAAMHAIIDYFKQVQGCSEVYISFVPDNEPAKKLYASVSFIDTGEIEDGELVYRLALSQ